MSPENKSNRSDRKNIKRELLELIKEYSSSPICRDTSLGSSVPVISDSDLFVCVVKIGYGKGKQNPVSELTTFYQPVKAGTKDSVGTSEGKGEDTQNSSSMVLESRDDVGIQEDAQQYRIGLAPQGIDDIETFA